jgi:hypothetical protein
MIVLMVALFLYNAAILNEQTKIENEAKKLKDDLSSIKKNISDSQLSLKIWNNGIKSILTDRSGIKIKLASKILEQLKDTYKVKDLAISLSNPEVRTDIIPTQFSKLVFTNGTMTFRAYTDIYAYQFINSFVTQLPGFIQIRSLTLVSESSTDYLSDINTGKLDTLVKAKLEFIWQDMQDIKEGDTKKATSLVKPTSQRNDLLIN